MGVLQTLKRVQDLQAGDIVDLEGDKFADPAHNKVELQFEGQTVVTYDWETTQCICVYFESFTCGFPPDHMLPIIGRDTDGVQGL